MARAVAEQLTKAKKARLDHQIEIAQEKRRQPHFAEADTVARKFQGVWNDCPLRASIFHVAVESSEIGEGMEGLDKLDQARDAVQAATQTVKETTQSIADAVEAAKPRAPLDRLVPWTQKAPLHAVTVAFLVGILFGRRRR